MRAHRLSQGLPCVIGILVLVAASGCDRDFARWTHVSRAQFERRLAQQVALDGSGTLDVLTRSGSITITGADVADCNVVARIVAHAPTEQEAQELAEQVQIVAQTTGSTLTIRSREPDPMDNRSVGISYTITVPRRMNVKCDSRYGRLDVSNIEGCLDGRSSNGSIQARDIRGTTDLKTSYGSIECRNLTGESITLHSGNGSIAATELRGSLTAASDYGSIACEDFSGGDLRLKSGNGRIAISNASFGVCDARSSYGTVTGRGFKGNSVGLHSGNGGIEADDVQAKELDLSSSYGSIRATQVAASGIKAASGNGSVRVACSPAAPADLSVEVQSSYGSVEFDAPDGFSGQVHLSTDYGTIRTALPVTMSGEITKKKIDGRIGAGAGSIRLESGSGSVELR